MASEELKQWLAEPWLLQIIVFAAFSVTGIFAAIDVSQRHGYGVALMLYGYLICLIWLATR